MNDQVVIGPCKCGGYGQVFDLETERELGMCHRNITSCLTNKFTKTYWYAPPHGGYIVSATDDEIHRGMYTSMADETIDAEERAANARLITTSCSKAFDLHKMGFNDVISIIGKLPDILGDMDEQSLLKYGITRDA